MEVIDGSWTLFGLDSDDPNCIHTVEEAEVFIDKVGFLPLFRNEIDGFSLEEHTNPSDWWSGNPEKDPWMWRAIIASKHNILYGKYFNKKAGFISKKFIPDFVNYRRDGYDFDALFDDGKAPFKHKKIMMNFMDDYADQRIMSYDLKEKAGFGKNGEKGFDGVITKLMMQTYLCNSDFRKKMNKKHEEFGWDVAEYATPESIFGYKYVTSHYKDAPNESYDRLVARIKKLYPQASEKAINKVLK